MLVAATALATTDDAFAKKKYGQSNTQSSASANECGPTHPSGDFSFSQPVPTNCLNDTDQIIDGAASVSNPRQQNDVSNQ